MERLFNNSFTPTDAVPNVQVMMNEPISVSSRLRTDEEEEMMRRMLRHLDDPRKDDPGIHPIPGWQLPDQSLGLQVAQFISGNINTIGLDTGDNDFLANVINAACLWIPLPLPTCRIDPAPPQAHSYLSMRLSILCLGSCSQIRAQNGIHTRARQSVHLLCCRPDFSC